MKQSFSPDEPTPKKPTKPPRTGVPSPADFQQRILGQIARDTRLGVRGLVVDLFDLYAWAHDAVYGQGSGPEGKSKTARADPTSTLATRIANEDEKHRDPRQAGHDSMERMLEKVEHAIADLREARSYLRWARPLVRLSLSDGGREITKAALNESFEAQRKRRAREESWGVG